MADNIKVVLFDNDGTLVDTYDAILGSMHHAFTTVMGHDLPDERVTKLVGLPLQDQMELFADDPSQIDDLLVTYRTHNEDRLEEKTQTFAGLLEALAALDQRGYRQGVVTSKRRGVALRGLEQFGYVPYFELINGVEASTAHKPEPEPLLNAARDLGIDPGHCVYVGDSPFDLHAAKAAGMTCIAVTWGKFFTGDVLALEQPDRMIDDPSQLVDAVVSLG